MFYDGRIQTSLSMLFTRTAGFPGCDAESEVKILKPVNGCVSVREKSTTSLKPAFGDSYAGTKTSYVDKDL